MGRILPVCVCLLAMLFLNGCFFSSETKRTTTTRAIDPATGTEKVVMVEEDQDFWESGNLRMYYEADAKRTDNHREIADRKITGILESGARRTYSTPTEATLGSVIDSLLIAQILDTAPPPSSTAPKTAEMQAHPPRTQIEYHHRDPGEWTGWNKFFLASAIGGQAGDAATTIHGIDSGKCHEVNPLFGEDPDAEVIIASKVGLMLFGVWIAEHVYSGRPDQHVARNWVYGALALTGIGAAAWNAGQDCE